MSDHPVKASVSGVNVVVRSPYSEDTVARFRRIRETCGGGWDAAQKAWVFPDTASTWAALHSEFGVSKPAPRPSGGMPYGDFEPWQHQKDAFEFAFGRTATLLAHDMGCGKSATAISLVNAWRARRVLVVCPLSVVPVWPKQFSMHSASSYNVVALDNYGSVARRKERAEKALQSDAPTALVINYEGVRREPFASWALAQQWDVLVLDECVAEGTKIATPHGDKPIESLDYSDSIWGFDERTGRVVPARVTGTMRRNTDEQMYRIEDTVMTGNHPVYEAGKGYRPVADLWKLGKVNCIMLKHSREGGAQSYQKSLRVSRYTRTSDAESSGGRVVCNLETTTGNYFANGLLVHNCHRVKAPTGLTSRFVARLRNCAARRVGLSGTPLAHSPLDAFGVCRALDEGLFGRSYYRFKRQWAVMGGYQGYEFLRLADPDAFAQRLGIIMHRVEKRDVLDLPKTVHEQRYCTLSGAAARAYKEMEQEFTTWVAEDVGVTATNALVKLLRLQQITGGNVMGDDGQLHAVGDDKAKAFADFLSDHPKDEPLVVFARFSADVDAIASACADAGLRVARMTGALKELAAWQRGDAEVLVAQIQVGSEGIDLTRAATCVFYSLGYSLAQYMQALARLDRPGQTRSVTYVHILAKGTVDERVMEALDKRQQVVETIINASKRPTEGVRDAG